jgi:hypothetical protein
MLSIAPASIFAQSAAYQWAKRMGGSDSDQGNAIATDANGNVYVTGDFEGTADFDPSAGTANLTSTGTLDIFLAKYDASGNLLWANRMGGQLTDRGNSLAVDGSGNVVVTGGFRGIVDFDPSVGTANLTSVGNQDIFVAKYDASGNYLWANGMGGADGEADVAWRWTAAAMWL